MGSNNSSEIQVIQDRNIKNKYNNKNKNNSNKPDINNNRLNKNLPNLDNNIDKNNNNNNQMSMNNIRSQSEIMKMKNNNNYPNNIINQNRMMMNNNQIHNGQSQSEIIVNNNNNFKDQNLNQQNTNMNNENNIKKNYLEQFEKIRKIGGGKFGEVFLYKHIQDNKNYALKKLYISDAKEETIKVFHKESKILEQINHPNIVRHFLSFEENGNYYIVIEYCPNGDLDHLISLHKSKNEPIKEEVIWKVAYQSLDALNYLHTEKQIIHQDIKPQNILFSQSDDVKIGDFGLSGIIPAISNATTTIRFDSLIGGTIPYIPPEGFSGKKTFKSDIWSLGVTLYEMIQFELPFEGEDFILKNNILSKSPKKLNPIYSKELNNLIMKMLIKDPVKRPTAKDCMIFIPKETRYKYERIRQINLGELLLYSSLNPLNQFYSLFGIGFVDVSMPIEIKEEFNDLYSIIYDFPNLSWYNFICPFCKESGNKEENVFPLIKINIENISVNSICKGGHNNQYDVKDFYKQFIDPRLEINDNFCCLCGRENESPEEITYRYCNDCKSILCRKCEKEHKIKFSEHKILDKRVNTALTCIKHNKLFSKFCDDCIENLCEDCVIEHNNANIGHSIKEIENISDIILKNAKKNIEEIKESLIKNEELIKTMNCFKNKYYILQELNRIKLFVLYKYSFVKLYEENYSNYIIAKNFLENNYEIFKPHLLIKNEMVCDIFTPRIYRSILDFSEEKTKKEKVFEDAIIDIITIEKNKLLIFLKSEIKIINDLSNLIDESILKIEIDNVMRLKNGKFLVSHLNELKIFSLSKSEQNTYNFSLSYKFENFTNDNISSFIELDDEKLVVLSGGHLTVLIKKDDAYEIYKNNFYMHEKIYSIVNINENLFASTSEIKGEEFCCHIQIWDSKEIKLNYNSFQHYHFPKNKNNAIKYNNKSILILAGKSSNTKYKNSIIIFDCLTYDYSQINLLSAEELSNIFSISNNCFILCYKTNDKFYLYQYEYFKMNPTNIGYMELDNKEINKVLIFDNNLIISEKEGKLIIYN